MAARRKPLVLVADDESDIRASLRMILEYEGYALAEAASGEEALAKLETERPDVVLLDIKMPRIDGLEVLARIKQSDPALSVVVISGHATIATAIEATRLGAFDFMEKPLERERVLVVVRNALERSRLESENRDYKLTYEERFQLVGASRAMRAVHDQIALAAPTKASVLVTGESGTGKELVARAIHRNSPRAAKRFVKVNCAAIPEELIESELFGHERGSFTGAVRDQTGKFAQADGGTIFLDEIGDMSLKTQSKALRALQDGEIEPVGSAKSFVVDVRVIAATNKRLEEEIAEGRFREDLFFRLNVVPIHLPPLRERREDIPALVAAFADAFCREHGSRPKAFAPDVVEALAGLPWRGNVRELRNAVERLMIMTPRDTIRADDIPEGLGLSLGGATAPSSVPPPAASATLQDFKDAAERAFIVAKLEENDWNVAATAKAIDTPRSNLYKKLEAYGIRREGGDS
ncbi:MAG TPA: sigma-54 dependent transcriptional regulator [Candidatus Polarisedimenticolaceae bacterium]|nr:sigma-54 dependent transcriptional regulator [Candidatus Polarisedimenticolaceae bacterium]